MQPLFPKRRHQDRDVEEELLENDVNFEQPHHRGDDIEQRRLSTDNRVRRQMSATYDWTSRDKPIEQEQMLRKAAAEAANVSNRPSWRVRGQTSKQQQSKEDMDREYIRKLVSKIMADVNTRLVHEYFGKMDKVGINAIVTRITEKDSIILDVDTYETLNKRLYKNAKLEIEKFIKEKIRN